MNKILFLLLLSTITHAQQYPVDCRVMIAPPYSANWIDYANSPMKFRVQMILRDLSKPSLEVCLRIRLKSATGLYIGNADDFIAAETITLSPGVPHTVAGVELTENFAKHNLETQGIDLDATTSLPIGFYTWEVYAVERYRDRQVSAVGMATMMLAVNKPPILNAPTSSSTLLANATQSILFNWTPRHTVSPTAGVSYTLFMYEIPDDFDGDRNDGVATQIAYSDLTPFRVIETFQPNYMYSPFEVPLTQGKRYAWQVQVNSIDGSQAFENNGFSEVNVFSYGTGPSTCATPTNATATVDGTAVTFGWDQTPTATAYTLSYRLPNATTSTDRRQAETSHRVIQQPDTYQYRLQAHCGIGQNSAFTDWLDYTISPEIKNNDDDETAYTSDSTLAYTDPMAVVQDASIISDGNNNPVAEPIDILTSPIKIFIPDENSSSDTPTVVNTLPANATVEQLQEALKSKKPICAGISSSYSCGSGGGNPTYSGPTVAVAAGDEIAMNALTLVVCSLDASGNGEGLIKIPMMGLVKIGVNLSGIKVAKGGCILAGEAKLGQMSAQVLSDQLHQALGIGYNEKQVKLTVNVDAVVKSISDAIAAIDKYFKEIKAKKDETAKLLAGNNIENMAAVLDNCTEIATKSKMAQDSLQKIYCQILIKPTKGLDPKKIKVALTENIAFMNKLGPALNECNAANNFTPWAEKDCPPKGSSWANVGPDPITLRCQNGLNKVFGVKLKADDICDAIKKLKLDNKYCTKATFISKGGFALTIENYQAIDFYEDGKVKNFSVMNTEGEKEIFEYQDKGYISLTTGENYIQPTRNTGDLKFLVVADDKDKTSNVFQTKNEDDTDAKPAVAVKKQVVSGAINSKSSPLENLSIYSTNKNPSIGKFGCMRDGPDGCIYSIGNGTKNHHGLDLIADVGTTVKSIYKGIIHEVKGEYFKPRNKKFIYTDFDVDGKTTKGNNGCHYSANSYGKQIIVEYLVPKGIKGIDGKMITKFYVMYGHLNSVVKTSGEVKSGEKIGECGCSGNAASIPENEHHVHMEASTSPSDFIPGVKRKINIENLIFNQK